MAGIILAGGKATRLGGVPKALQVLEAETLLDRVVQRVSPLFAQLILVTNTSELYRDFPGQVVTDGLPHRGPLGGIEAGLLASADQVNFVTGCDMPFLNPELVGYMRQLAQEYDVVVPRLGRFIEPLHAFYSQQALKVIQRQLKAGKLKLNTLLSAPLRVYYLTEEQIRQYDPYMESFFNINTPEDLSRARKVLSKEDGAYDAHKSG